jgi:hypothetical protein
MCDQSTEYTRGVSTGAPEAIQVDDRWYVFGAARVSGGSKRTFATEGAISMQAQSSRTVL